MSMRMVCCIVILSTAFFASTGAASAAQSKQEQILQRETGRLDRTASTPEGETAVVARLSRNFAVAPERIAALRERGFGYGEITVALSCARSLPGGATGENIERVLMLRQGPPVLGWGAVAQKLGIKLGMSVSQVKKVNNESHREMKKGRVPAASRATQAPAAAPKEPHRAFDGEGKSLPRREEAQ